ncbi:hypothetical protein Tco_1117399, partial [Tanacetum coccineum]
MTQIGSLTGQYRAEGLVAVVHSIVDPGRSYFVARAYGKECLRLIPWQLGISLRESSTQGGRKHDLSLVLWV